MLENAPGFYYLAVNVYRAPGEDVSAIKVKEHLYEPVRLVLSGLYSEMEIAYPVDHDLSALEQRQDLISSNDLNFCKDIIKRFADQPEPGELDLNAEIKTDLKGVAGIRKIAEARIKSLSSASKVADVGIPLEKSTVSAGLIILTIVGIFIGSMLVSTGIFAPFGAGILAQALLSAIGGGIGLMTGLGVVGGLHLANRVREMLSPGMESEQDLIDPDKQNNDGYVNQNKGKKTRKISEDEVEKNEEYEAYYQTMFKELDVSSTVKKQSDEQGSSCNP